MLANTLSKFIVAMATVFISTLPAQAQDHAALASRYAPVHHQVTDETRAQSDYIAAVNYDSDWVATNNWDNLGEGLWPATVYYSVVESTTHWFISYGFYHPQDWGLGGSAREHENDMHGVIMSVRKDAQPLGTLEGMLTVGDNENFFSYVPAGSPYKAKPGGETIDGAIEFSSNTSQLRPKTAASSKHHGVKAWSLGEVAGKSVVVYYPTGGAAEYPTSHNDSQVPYQLVDILARGGLWSAALIDIPRDSKGDTFVSFGRFSGDATGGCGRRSKKCPTNQGLAPWGWDDHDDGATYGGEWVLDPASLFAFYFDGIGDFGRNYVDNRFLSYLRDSGYSTAKPPAGLNGNIKLDALYEKLLP